MATQASLIPIKIQCGCGQRYAFDVEPIAGRMPGAVSCPVCGADGTSAANAVLAGHFQAQPPAPPVRVSVAAGAPPTPAHTATAVAAPVRVAVASPASSAPSHSPPHAPRLPGQLDPERAQNEARSKIMWGDDPAEVSKFLMSHGFSAEEAKDTLAPMLLERAGTVRKTGMTKIFTGAGMMLLPVIAWSTFRSIGIFPLKLFGVTVAIGVWGAARVISGTIMFLSPKSEKGDVAEM